MPTFYFELRENFSQGSDLSRTAQNKDSRAKTDHIKTSLNRTLKSNKLLERRPLYLHSLLESYINATADFMLSELPYKRSKPFKSSVPFCLLNL